MQARAGMTVDLNHNLVQAPTCTSGDSHRQTKAASPKQCPQQ